MKRISEEMALPKEFDPLPHGLEGPAPDEEDPANKS
jgi:hypothetical protein